MPDRPAALFDSSKASVEDLLARNAAWAERMQKASPELFKVIGSGQSPKILWIGCSDSRVPETALLDLNPGEVFVVRNIANVVPNMDISLLAAVQFAVEVLKVEHVILCGHYNCGGCIAALGDKRLGLIDNWLREVRDVRAANRDELDAIKDDKERAARLVELNVKTQVRKLERVSYIYEAVKERDLKVHPMVFDVATGKLKLLEKFKDSQKECYLQGAYDLSAH
ncbi:hypothetical protein PYCC9005_003676 [Savitreella phatthalungensis]